MPQDRQRADPAIPNVPRSSRTPVHNGRALRTRLPSRPKSLSKIQLQKWPTVVDTTQVIPRGCCAVSCLQRLSPCKRNTLAPLYNALKGDAEMEYCSVRKSTKRQADRREGTLPLRPTNPLKTASECAASEKSRYIRDFADLNCELLQSDALLGRAFGRQ